MVTARYERQDAFYRKAKEEGFRSRAAYKLESLLGSLPRLKAGDAVVDLGCWPGGWLQILAERVGPTGCVIGVDTEQVDPLGDPVLLLQLDMTQPDAVEQIATALGERKAVAVLSDAAPKLTGIKDVDRAAIEELHEAALAVADRVMQPKGTLVVKAFPGPESQAFRGVLNKRFGRVTELRPEGKRASSKEFYWVAGPRPPSGGGRSGKGRRRRGSSGRSSSSRS